MRAVLGLVQDTVQRYGGTLLEVSGTGCVALFGAPVAHEDHARRAVLAASELRQRLRAPDAIPGQPHGVVVRLGLHTGPVVVGPLGHDPQRPYTAMGDTLTLAIQLQHQAPPDTVLVSAATYALVQAEVEGVVWIAGPSDTVSTLMTGYVVYGLLRRRAGVPRRGAWPLSPLVGRARELALLHERLALAASGQGQVVGIAGEPGMGKSRLLAAFAHRLAGQPVTYCEGHCLAYGQATPYLPVRDLLRQLWDLPDTATPEAITTAVQQRLHEAGMVTEDGVPLLLQLLDVPGEATALATLDPQTRRTRTFALLRQLVLHASQRQPLVLAVENLHWSDPTSTEWLTALAAQVGGAAILLLATYRPGTRPSWLAHSWATQVALPRLNPSDSLAVVQAVPGATQLSARQQQAIVAKAAGNPFFVEELTWAAVAHSDPTRPLPLPDTIQAVLAARIDRLPLEAKRLVQIAAVIGPEVPGLLLQRLAGVAEDALQHGLAHLQDMELLYETRLFPEPVYTFKHALTHEVAYSSLLHERRRALHAEVVEALETLAGDRPDVPVERLAQHALQGQVWDKALQYCRQAGARAFARSAYREAVGCWEQALAALAHLPPERPTLEQAVDVRCDLSLALQSLAQWEQALTYLRDAESLAEGLGDHRRLGRVCRRAVYTPVGFLHVCQGALQQAIPLLERAVALSQEADILSYYRLAAPWLALAYTLAGRATDALAMLWQVEGKSVVCGEAYLRAGGVEEVHRLAQRGLAHARQRNMWGREAWALWLLGEIARRRDLPDIAPAEAHYQQALTLAETLGLRPLQAHCHLGLGTLYAATGRREPARAALAAAIELYRAMNMTLWLPPAEAALAQVA